jgi:hypothetical protein
MSVFLREALILRTTSLPYARSSRRTNKVAARHVLEMLDEGVVHGSTAQRADERNGLRSELLRHHYSKAGRNLGDKANENGATFLDHATLDRSRDVLQRQTTARHEIKDLRVFIVETKKSCPRCVRNHDGGSIPRSNRPTLHR